MRIPDAARARSPDRARAPLSPLQLFGGAQITTLSHRAKIATDIMSYSLLYFAVSDEFPCFQFPDLASSP